MKKLLSTLLFLFVIAILSLSAQMDIYPPTLLAPEDADTNVMPDVILNWSAVGGSGGQVEYELQLDVTDAFTSPVTFPKTELSGLQMEDLLFYQSYYWRVRAYDGAEVSDWSDVFTFKTFNRLELSKPGANQDEQEPNVEFKIKSYVGSSQNTLTGVDYIQFQADTSTSFNSGLLWAGQTTEQFMNASYLHFGQTYNWRARAWHGTDTSAWSELRQFEVWIAPELDKPNNNSSDMGLEVVLEWDEIEGIVDYEVQISDDENFTAPHAALVEEEEYITNGYMYFNQDFWWRVRANHATDTSDWSEVWKLTTVSTVTLESPENGEENVGINPRLEWDEITGVDFFNVQYNNTNNFDDPCCDEYVEGTEDFFQVIYILEHNTTHYWRCRTIKGIDTTAWSEVWSFTTVPEDYGIDEGFDASSINIYPNPSNGILNIDIQREENSEVSIHIMDMLGQVHLQETVVYGQGNTTRHFDLNDFANGLYIVKLTKGDQTYSHKITVHK